MKVLVAEDETRIARFIRQALEEQDPSRLVVVATYTNAVEATLARTSLEARGIPAMVKDRVLPGLATVLDAPLDGAKVLVRHEDYGHKTTKDEPQNSEPAEPAGDEKQS